MTDHDTLLGMIDAYLNNQLDADSRAHVEKLMETDADVREYMHAEQLVQQVLPRYRHADATDLANRGLVARVASATAQRRKRTIIVYTGALSLAAASVVVVILGDRSDAPMSAAEPNRSLHSVVSSSVPPPLPELAAHRGATAPSKSVRRTYAVVVDQPLGTSDIVEALEDMPYEATVDHLVGSAYGDNTYWLTDSDMNMLMENDDES